MRGICENNDICINVITKHPYFTLNFSFIITRFEVKSLSYTMSAVAISPLIADAVTVAAEARYTKESLCPARPLKFRVPVLIRVSPSPITPPDSCPQHVRAVRIHNNCTCVLADISRVPLSWPEDIPNGFGN